MKKQLTKKQIIKNKIANSIIKNIDYDFTSWTPEARKEAIDNMYNDLFNN
jgi:hypothetical protein